MRRTAALLATTALIGLLAGCDVGAEKRQTTTSTSADPTTTAGPTPPSSLPLTFECDEDAASACSQPGAVRWSVPLDLPVGVSGTGEHGNTLLLLTPHAVADDRSAVLHTVTFDIVEGRGYFMDGTHLRVVDAGTGALLSSVDLPTAGRLTEDAAPVLGQGRVWWVRTLFDDEEAVELVSIRPGDSQPTVLPLADGESLAAFGDSGIVTATSTAVRGSTLDGTPLWETSLKVDGYVQVDAGIAYVGTSSGLERVDVLTGAQLEEITFAALNRSPSTLVEAQDGVVTFLNADRKEGWSLDLATLSTSPVSQPRKSAPRVSTAWPSPPSATVDDVLTITGDAPGLPLSVWQSKGGTAVLNDGQFLESAIGCAEGPQFTPHSNGAPEYIADCPIPVLFATNQ